MTTYAAVPAISTVVEMTYSGEPFDGLRIDDVRGDQFDLFLPPNTGHLPAKVGDVVTLRWSAGPRGRYVVRGVVVELPGDNRLAVEISGTPQIEQRRQFVRGGGGEPVRVHRPDSDGSVVFVGLVQDISEQAVRAHFTDASVKNGDPLRIRIHLGKDSVDVIGTALRVSELPGASVSSSGAFVSLDAFMSLNATSSPGDAGPPDAAGSPGDTGSAGVGGVSDIGEASEGGPADCRPPEPVGVEVIAVFVADEGQAQVIRRYVLQQELRARKRWAEIDPSHSPDY